MVIRLENRFIQITEQKIAQFQDSFQIIVGDTRFIGDLVDNIFIHEKEIIMLLFFLLFTDLDNKLFQKNERPSLSFSFFVEDFVEERDRAGFPDFFEDDIFLVFNEFHQ